MNIEKTMTLGEEGCGEVCLQRGVGPTPRTHTPACYIHFASCFYIDIYCIMGCYYTLHHNTYAYYFLFYKVYMKRGNAGSWNSGLEKEQILETYSAHLQKS